MWNNSYRSPTEHWQETSDFPKGKKIPMYLGRAKEKRKSDGKRKGTGPARLGGSLKEEKFPCTRKPLHSHRRGWVGGSFGGMEETTTTRVLRAKQRDSRTEDQC